MNFKQGNKHKTMDNYFSDEDEENDKSDDENNNENYDKLNDHKL